MPGKIKIFLATTAGDVKSAESLSLPCAYLIYRVGENGNLQRVQLPIVGRGGVMGIYDGSGLVKSDIHTLTREISAECRRQSFDGVVLDFEPNVELLERTSQLSSSLKDAGILHFASLGLAASASYAKVIVPSAISGGSFEEMLSGFASRFGAQNLCMEVVRTCNDFLMPSYSPEGQTLTARQFAGLMEQYSPTPYFSGPLCAKYFTYHSGSESHFVLFDDPDTAERKISIAESMGYWGAFLLFRDWGPAAKNIVKRPKP